MAMGSIGHTFFAAHAGDVRDVLTLAIDRGELLIRLEAPRGVRLDAAGARRMARAVLAEIDAPGSVTRRHRPVSTHTEE